MPLHLLRVGSVLAILALWGGGASAQGTITVGFDAADPPLMYEASGKAAGLYPDLIAAIFAKMGVSISTFAAPWTRVLAGADAGTNGVGGIYKNAAREAKYDYSAPIYEEEIAIYTQGTKAFDFKDIDSLSGKTIGVIRGWSYGDDFDKARAAQKFRVEEVEGDELNVTKLGLGRLDAIVGIPLSVDAAIRKNRLGGKIAKLPEALSKNPTYLVFSKTADKEALLEQFDDALAKSRTDGSYDQIIRNSLAK